LISISVYVVECTFSGIIYLLTLSLSGYSKENFLKYTQYKKLKV